MRSAEEAECPDYLERCLFSVLIFIFTHPSSRQCSEGALASIMSAHANITVDIHDHIGVIKVSRKSSVVYLY